MSKIFENPPPVAANLSASYSVFWHFGQDHFGWYMSKTPSSSNGVSPAVGLLRGSKNQGQLHGRQDRMHELPLFQALEEGGRGHGLAFGGDELLIGFIPPERLKKGMPEISCLVDAFLEGLA